jgi:hypothetical protein
VISVSVRVGRELETAQGKALEYAKRFFPNGKGWKAWLKSQKTCEGTSAAIRASLYHAGYSRTGGPQNTLTRFDRLTREILQTEDDPRWPQFEAAVKRLIEEYTPAEEP